MRIAAFFALLSIVSLPSFGQEEQPIVADRPGFADGAATVGNAVFQLETGLTVDRQDDETLTLPTLLRYGFGGRFELRIESEVAAFADGEAELAPIAAGFKLRLTDGALPLALMAKVQPPSGEGSLRSDGFEGEARLVSDIDLGSGFTLTPNAGVELAEDRDATALFAMTLEKEVGNALPFVDFETRAGNGDTSLIADAGVAWIVGRDTQLDVSGGFDLAGDDYPEWFVAAGFSRRF